MLRLFCRMAPHRAVTYVASSLYQYGSAGLSLVKYDFGIIAWMPLGLIASVPVGATRPSACGRFLRPRTDRRTTLLSE